MRFLQTNGSSNSTNAGNPALLVSTTLPRSILDFLYVSSSQSTTESIDIDDPSPTGRYWVALYANTPGGFDLSASRLSFAVSREEAPSFGHQLASWLLASTAGYVVLVSANTYIFKTPPIISGCTYSLCRLVLECSSCACAVAVVCSIARTVTAVAPSRQPRKQPRRTTKLIRNVCAC